MEDSSRDRICNKLQEFIDIEPRKALDSQREEIAKTIAAARRILKVEVPQLAHALNVSTQAVYRWERASSVASRENLSRLVQLLRQGSVPSGRRMISVSGVSRRDVVEFESTAVRIWRFAHSSDSGWTDFSLLSQIEKNQQAIYYFVFPLGTAADVSFAQLADRAARDETIAQRVIGIASRGDKMPSEFVLPNISNTCAVVLQLREDSGANQPWLGFTEISAITNSADEQEVIDRICFQWTRQDATRVGLEVCVPLLASLEGKSSQLDTELVVRRPIPADLTMTPDPFTQLAGLYLMSAPYGQESPKVKALNRARWRD